jgi:hypothetical protein
MISSREASPELVQGRIITQEPPFVSTYKNRKPRFFSGKLECPQIFPEEAGCPKNTKIEPPEHEAIVQSPFHQ